MAEQVPTYKAGDTFPAFSLALEDQNGPIDLTLAKEVLILMEGTKGQEVSGVCTIVEAKGGAIEYKWATKDLEVADTYRLEFKIIWSVGSEESVPNEGYNQLIVEENLG